MSYDTDPAADVGDELFWDPKVDSAAIAVSANDGEITLRGTVGSLREKRDGLVPKTVDAKVADGFVTLTVDWQYQRDEVESVAPTSSVRSTSKTTSSSSSRSRTPASYRSRSGRPSSGTPHSTRTAFTSRATTARDGLGHGQLLGGRVLTREP
jgi:BON domain